VSAGAGDCAWVKAAWVKAAWVKAAWVKAAWVHKLKRRNREILLHRRKSFFGFDELSFSNEFS
jgi:hypothetical protein